MRKLLAAILAGSMLFAGVACDDNEGARQGTDEDDSRPGPGDGKNEVGPGR